MRKSLLIVSFLCSLAPATTYYLDASATGNADGSDWTNAWTTIAQAQAALNALDDKGSGDTVLINTGEYGNYDEGRVSRTDWLMWRADTDQIPTFGKVEVGAYLDAGHSLVNAYIKFVGITINGDRENNIWVYTYDTNYAAFDSCTVVGDGYKFNIADPNSEDTKAFFIPYSYNITINNCTITGDGDSLLDSWPSITVCEDAPEGIDPNEYGKGCQWGVYNYPYHPTYYGNLTITNNTIEYCHRGIQVGHVINSSISNNTIHNITDDAINIESACENESGQYLDINYNHLYNEYSFTGGEGEPDIGGHNDGIQIQAVSGATWQIYHNVNVIGNKIHDIQDQALWMRSSYESTNWVLQNNLIYKCPASTTNTSRILITGVQGLTIENNTIINNGNSANTGFEIKADTQTPTTVPTITSFAGNIVEKLNLYIDTNPITISYEDYNIVDIAWLEMDGWTPGEHDIFLDDNITTFKALFTDYDNDTFTLASGSSALNAGDPDNHPLTDILRVDRAGTPDAGCYEYVDPNSIMPSRTVYGGVLRWR